LHFVIVLVDVVVEVHAYYQTHLLFASAGIAIINADITTAGLYDLQLDIDKANSPVAVFQVRTPTIATLCRYTVDFTPTRTDVQSATPKLLLSCLGTGQTAAEVHAPTTVDSYVDYHARSWRMLLML
jgi:hypothetical protein